ncbi:plasmid mobilization relaxosome protein MobC [Morganella morganii]|uniref:plasmid mobilization protein n=1 Tax=Morganella morganii TaxID=582 RepID=UPI001646CDE6|nr:plasmid mobilization relaxosome protein MobC [Morganella morganii]MBC3997507.1 plasmid mobilization relaxosome protein MobC [Morganella morganii]
MKESKIERKNMVSFRLTDGEYEPFKKIIDKMEVSRSEFFRMMVLGQTDAIPELKTKKPPEYDRLLFLFNKASNNINQLAKQVNTAHKDGLLTEKKLADWYRKLSIITDNLLAGINRAG